MIREHKINDISYISGNDEICQTRPSIIFIHGAGGSKILWQAQVEALKDAANTFAIDLPGHGMSDSPGMDSIDAYADKVMDFIIALNPPSPVACGLSMGGAIAQKLIILNKEVFKGCILISTGAKLKVMPAIFETIKTNYYAYIELIGMIASSKKSNFDLFKPLFSEMAKCPVEVVINDFKACDEFDARQLLSLITLPVLIITSNDDQLTPPKYGDFLEKNIKNTSRVHVMDAGHLVPIEKPYEVNEAIKMFLDKL